MKFVNKLLLALIVLSFSTAFASPLKWYSFQEGLEKAQQENKLILIDFYTDWCGWCKKMDKETYSDAKIISLVESGFVPVKVNPEEDKNRNIQRRDSNCRRTLTGAPVCVVSRQQYSTHPICRSLT